VIVSDRFHPYGGDRTSDGDFDGSAATASAGRYIVLISDYMREGNERDPNARPDDPFGQHFGISFETVSDGKSVARMEVTEESKKTVEVTSSGP
jgi:hypothetical protein